MSIESPKLAVIPDDDTTASDRAHYDAQGLGNDALLPDLRLTPQRQGRLDAYCGIYALINGFAYASRNSHKTRLQAKELFSLLSGRAQRVHGGHQVCLEGLTPAQLRQVALTLAIAVPQAYIPDFLVCHASGKMLALEIKGTDSPLNKAKRDALSEWVNAIDGTGEFGQWAWGVAFKPSDVQVIVSKHAKAPVPEPVSQ